MDVEIKFLQTFRDGNILSEPAKMFQTMRVSEVKYKQLVASGAEIEVIRKIIPPHRKADEKP